MQDREIKFRAWDKSRMIHFEDFSIGLTKGKAVKPYVYFLSDTFNGEVKLEKHTIMQWTGLLDHRGVEIYEGDIMSILLGENEGCDFQPVFFKNGCFLIGTLDPTPLHEELDYWKDKIQIAGNIYENPTLVSASAKTEA